MSGLTAQDVLTVVIGTATASILVGTALVGTLVCASRAAIAIVRWASRTVRARLRH